MFLYKIFRYLQALYLNFSVLHVYNDQQWQEVAIVFLLAADIQTESDLVTPWFSLLVLVECSRPAFTTLSHNARFFVQSWQLNIL